MADQSKTVKIDADLHARLTKAAAERVVGVHVLVEHAVRDYLDDLIPLEELQLTRARVKKTDLDRQIEAGE